MDKRGLAGGPTRTDPRAEAVTSLAVEAGEGRRAGAADIGEAQGTALRKFEGLTRQMTKGLAVEVEDGGLLFHNVLVLLRGAVCSLGTPFLCRLLPIGYQRSDSSGQRSAKILSRPQHSTSLTAQAWVSTVQTATTATGKLSIGYDALQIDNACSAHHAFP